MCRMTVRDMKYWSAKTILISWRSCRYKGEVFHRRFIGVLLGIWSFLWLEVFYCWNGVDELGDLEIYQRMTSIEDMLEIFSEKYQYWRYVVEQLENYLRNTSVEEVLEDCLKYKVLKCFKCVLGLLQIWWTRSELKHCF